MRIRAFAAAVTIVVAATACSSDGTTDTTPEATTTTGATTTEAPSTTAAPTTTTEPATTTTEAPTSPADAQAIVDAKAAAFTAAAPAGWAVEEQANDSFEEADYTYAPCLLAGDFDLDDLDPSTLAVKEVRASAPAGAIPFGSTSAIVEARVFDSEATAADAFAVIERIYGTDEGRQCMSEIVSSLFAEQSDAGFDFAVTVEEVEVEGAEVGTRTAMGASVEGFDFTMAIDLVASRDGATTVIATFIAFGEPFPTDVADALMSAAVAA